MPDPNNTPNTTQYRDDFFIDDNNVYVVDDAVKTDEDNTTQTIYTASSNDYADYLDEVSRRYE
ncbi:hypothetical protein A6770_28485 [Nostoc minutum NIES-26]|uniref:Uncharacterized protein n=1 Tax=Nostoc minutum NIES-26 TaxID=1844469 RepID=A0A367QJC4_9NOSO|nr:hypothetical protein A6770_28485 [Nostoc minutum NIES-26]